MWLFEELKLDYELKVYFRGKDWLAPKELKDIHPLGKSPVITILPEGAEKPIVLAESGPIIEYLAEHFGTWLIPKRYPEGKEGMVGGETEEWLRYRVSFMRLPLLLHISVCDRIWLNACDLCVCPQMQ